MGTRLKNIRFSSWFKLLAIIVGIIGIILGFYGLMKFPDFKVGVQNRNYLKSAVLKDEIRNIESLIVLNNNDGTEDNITSGRVISDDEIKDRTSYLESNRNNEIFSTTDEYSYQISDKLNYPNEVTRLEKERNDKIAEIKAAYKIQISKAKDTLIAEKLAEFRGRIKLLDSYKGLYFTEIDNGIETGEDIELYKTLPYFSKIDVNEDTVVYIGFSKEAFSKQTEEYNLQHKNGEDGIFKFISGLLIVFFSIIWLVYTAGRKPENEEINLTIFDRIYLDLGFCITFVVDFVCAALVMQFGRTVYNNIDNFDSKVFYIACISLISIAYIVFSFYIMSIAKRVKRREFLRHNLIYYILASVSQLIIRIFRDIRRGLDSGPLTAKLVLFLVLYFLSIIFEIALIRPFGTFIAFVIFAIVNIGIVHQLSKRLVGIKVLGEGVKKVKNGDLFYKIPSCGSHTLDNIAEDINNISEGLRNAVDKEMRAEHMKVELITNVSHDLKTPLTSIITYVDLLSQENVTTEETKEYIEIIKAKSEKLNHLIEDLFEVSKAESRTAPLVLEKLCLNDLITQSFAEFEDNYEATRLEIKLNMPQEKLMVFADGTKMWRVLSNVFNNALKYSLPGTRIYIDVEVEEARANITFKNISNYAMNFKAEEIVERFKRGDESRTGGGSGLGLAIVKSFMNLQNGLCEITIDGDLFKIKLWLNLV